MSIQIVGLRPYFSKEYQKNKLGEKWFKVESGTTESLFQNLEKVIACIPEEERFNLFYTMAHTKLRDRNRESFISCDVIAFDIDKIFTDEKERYLEPLSIALKVDLKKCGVIWSGNGVQVIIKLKESVGKEFFERKEAYLYWSERINKGLESAGLPGHCDTSVFEPARVLRLPFTKNIKPMNDLESANRNEKDATFYNRNLEYCGWELGQEQAPPKKEKTLKHDGPVDIEAVKKGCLFLKYAEENQETLSEPLWGAALGIAAWLGDADKTSHEISHKHGEYSYEETEKRCERKRAETAGPSLCETINTLWGGCKECPHYKKVKTPLLIKSPESHLKELDTFQNPKPDEMQIVYQLLKNFQVKFDIASGDVDQYDTFLYQQDGDLFRYNGVYWQRFSDEEVNQIKRLISKYYQFKAKNGMIESAYKTFLSYVPHLPGEDASLYKPNPFAINFTNGTLHLIEKGFGEYALEFRPHFKGDFLTNVIAGKYDPNFSEINDEFEQLLERIFAGDKDKDQKIKALGQMFGGAILPAFPHLFFLHGVAGGGKSTLCIILSNLLEKRNICSVQPHQFQGFQMESMAGKLVNMVTDVSSKGTISDDVIKQVEDRTEHRIQRKNKADIYAPLPSIHIFGANDLPKNFDGSSRAHDRRWTFIKFNNSATTHGQNYMRDFGNLVFKSNPQGILNFAVKGLIDLIKDRGIYCIPDTGKEALKAWQDENDIIAQFLADLGEGCLKEVALGKELKISRTDLWGFFEEWREEVGRKHSKMVRNKFYAEIEKRGYHQSKHRGERIFKGIGKGESTEEAEF